MLRSDPRCVALEHLTRPLPLGFRNDPFCQVSRPLDQDVLVTQLSRPQERRLAVFPRGGPPGAEVTEQASRLLPLTRVAVGFGSFQEHQVLGRKTTDAEGDFSVVLQVPAWARRDEVHYFVSYGDQSPHVISDPFHVTAPDGTARVTGTVTVEGMTCAVLSGPGEALYTLKGDTRSWPAGTRVLVIGTIGDPSACGVDGIPINVQQILVP